MFGIDPRNNRRIFTVTHFLGREGERLSIKNLAVIIKLLVFSDPILQRLSDRMIGIRISDFERFLRTVSGGVQTKMLSPLVCAIAEGMHRTVEMHRRNSFVHFEDVLH